MSDNLKKPVYTPPEVIDLSSNGANGFGILGICETGGNPVPGNACKTGLAYAGNCGTGGTPSLVCTSGTFPN